MGGLYRKVHLQVVHRFSWAASAIVFSLALLLLDGVEDEDHLEALAFWDGFRYLERDDLLARLRLGEDSTNQSELVLFAEDYVRGRFNINLDQVRGRSQRGNKFRQLEGVAAIDGSGSLDLRYEPLMVLANITEHVCNKVHRHTGSQFESTQEL